MLRQIRAILSVIVVVALLLGSVLYFGEQRVSAGGGEELPDRGNPKLDPQLNQLVLVKTSKEASTFARQNNIQIVDGGVRVIVECLPEQVDAATKVAGALGVVETSYRNLLQVVVPIPKLEILAETSSIRLVRLPWYPSISAIVSEGAELIHADEWHTAGYTGAGVKVAILDIGFIGYQSLLGNELPSSVTTQSFCYGCSDIEGYTAHGTACAEIIYDIAPDAEFYLVNFGTECEMGRAVLWLITQGVDVISCSVGWLLGGPGDGTGIICEMVDAARAAGILWSNSMGNQAQKHWQGDFTDTDADGWHEFSQDPFEEGNDIWAEAGDIIEVGLKWNDTWGCSDNDYDLYLFDDADPPNPIDLDYFRWTQDGDDDPKEWFYYIAEYTGFYSIKIYRQSATETVHFHLYSCADLEHPEDSGSLIVPADSPNAMSVGAINYSTPTTLEYFSSLGPTEDNRVKPDLVAPDGVSTNAYGTNSFFGTSASAPHAAGTAALVKERYPSHTPEEVQSFLEGRAFDLGDAGKDNLFGSGRLDLGSVPENDVPPLTIQAWEGANPIHYTGATMDLPDALTNISEITEIIWQRDTSTGGEWWYYLVPWDTGDITQLENGRVYVVVVSEDCTWEPSEVMSPSAPTLLTPAMGAVNVSTRPVFTWNAVPGALRYELTLSEDPTFAIIEWSYNVNDNFYKATDELRCSTTYYWRVRAIVDTQTGPWATGVFTTES